MLVKHKYDLNFILSTNVMQTAVVLLGKTFIAAIQTIKKLVFSKAYQDNQKRDLLTLLLPNQYKQIFLNLFIRLFNRTSIKNSNEKLRTFFPSDGAFTNSFVEGAKNFLRPCFVNVFDKFHKTENVLYFKKRDLLN